MAAAAVAAAASAARGAAAAAAAAVAAAAMTTARMRSMTVAAWAVGCGQRAAGGWGDDDGDNEVDDRSCDKVHCYSGVKFLQFLMH